MPKLLAVFLFAVTGFLGGTAMAQSNAPISVTLKELVGNFKNYDGKSVRVRGQVDNCTALYCSLCDLEMTRVSKTGACVGLQFDGYRTGPNGTGSAAEISEAFRFALVTLTAKFDALCAPGAAQTCTDQRLFLSGARVESVQGRKNALNGIISAYDFGNVSAPSAADRQAMLTELRNHGDFANMELAVFRVADTVYLKDGGLGCFCTADTCKDKWPNRYFEGFDSPANPFTCYEMQKIKGVWRVLLH